MPGEQLEKGIQNIYILGEDEGLILKANEAFTDPDTVRLLDHYSLCLRCPLLVVLSFFSIRETSANPEIAG